MPNVSPAPMKQERRATSGDFAPKMRCMKSMATRSPMPSEISVAQLIGAPDSALVSCSKSNGPRPSGITMPKVTATQTSIAIVATTVIVVWIAAV